MAFLHRHDTFDDLAPEQLAARERGWITRIRDGEEKAFEEMFRAYYLPLARFAAKLLGREHEAAKDLVHDVLFKVWQQRASWEVRDTLTRYLYGSVRNRCVDYLRRRYLEDRWRRQGELFRSEGERLLIASHAAEPADAVVESNEIDQAIASAIAQLPERCRQTFVLHWERGLTYGEIAVVMGTSPNTVKVQMKRALKSLRAALAPLLALAVSLTQLAK
jgi:RNA polymerase sigma-70 factor (ECF subfamily)